MQILHPLLLPYKLLPKYPGMRPRDEVIWDVFVQNNPGYFDTCEYNVAVGDPARTEEEREEMRYNGGDGVSFWRVDVLGKKGGKEYVIEIKPDAGAGSIGQVLAYKALLISEGKISLGAIPMIITDNASKILLMAADELGVVVHQV